jgi:DnaJ-class molecular chaperone
MTYKELQLAREVFGLGERVTLQEIKSRHRELVKLHHPDAGNTDHPEQIRKVNAAYQVLLEYLTQYSFSLTESEFYQQNPEERIRRQFMDDPLWGNG